MEIKFQWFISFELLTCRKLYEWFFWKGYLGPQILYLLELTHVCTFSLYTLFFSLKSSIFISFVSSVFYLPLHPLSLTVWPFNIIHYRCTIRACNMISCGECIFTVHCQPSYCPAIQYRRLWFWMIDKLCQLAMRYCVVNACTQYTVNPPTVWPVNIIHGFEWKVHYSSL